jgi:hypothetical protein
MAPYMCSVGISVSYKTSFILNKGTLCSSKHLYSPAKLHDVNRTDSYLFLLFIVTFYTDTKKTEKNKFLPADVSF